MNYKNIKIEPVDNGFKASVEVPKKVLDLELTEYLNRIDEINRLVINDKNELYIRKLLNRINKALEYIDIQFDNNGIIHNELTKILKGGSNE